METLKKLGIEKIEAVGHPFNHDLHDAVGLEDDGGEREVVIEELQPGYKMNGRVIRPAMVKVARK